MRFSLTLRLRVAQKEREKIMRRSGVAALFSIFFLNSFKIFLLRHAPVLLRAIPIWELYLPPNF
jgi:hypothetical protein